MPEQIIPVLLPLFEELQGERVLVRPYAESDAAALQEAVAESREHLRPWLVREDMGVGLFDAETGRYGGGSGLHPRGWDLRFFEIGYWVRRSAEGRGYVSEAVRLLADYAFASLAANRIMIRCDVRNLRSAAVARRLGFVQEALLRNDSLALDGTLRSTLVFALTPDDPRWPDR
jgi:RimJ/RimL family protein N-acetyltransferase